MPTPFIPFLPDQNRYYEYKNCKGSRQHHFSSPWPGLYPGIGGIVLFCDFVWFGLLQGLGGIVSLIFWPAILSGENPVERLADVILIEFRVTYYPLRIARMNELGNVVSWRQANTNGVFCPSGSIKVFESLSQCVRSDADNGIQLWIKRLGAAKRVYRNAVLFDFVDCSLEILFTNESQKSNKVVRPTEYTRGQNAVYLSPLRLKLADRRLQVLIPFKNGPFDLPSGLLEGV